MPNDFVGSKEENHGQDLVTVFETAVSLCVHKKLLTEGEGLGFNRSGELALRRQVCISPSVNVIHGCFWLFSP